MRDNNRPIIFYGPDWCKACNTRSIELFDYWNNPMRYHDMVKDYMAFKPNRFAILNKKTVYRLRCRNCGKDYTIRWDRGYPVPDLFIEDIDNKSFMQQYIDIIKQDDPKNSIKEKLNRKAQ